jgi:hypothetical protein
MGIRAMVSSIFLPVAEAAVGVEMETSRRFREAVAS